MRSMDKFFVIRDVKKLRTNLKYDKFTKSNLWHDNGQARTYLYLWWNF